MANAQKKFAARGLKGRPPNRLALGSSFAKGAQLRAFVGSRLRTRRLERSLTLERLAKQIEEVGGAISAAQISRIENQQADPSFIELYWLNEALGQPLGALFGQGSLPPWFIIRGAKARQRLSEITSGTREIQRRDDAHRKLTERGVYKYVPLERQDNDLVDPSDHNGTLLNPLLRAYLFQVGHANAALMTEEDSLWSHEGEEFIYVLSGEIEFWCASGQGESVQKSLRQDDCLHFSSRLTHGFRAVSQEPATALFIYTRAPTADTPPLVTTPFRGKAKA